MGRPRLNHDGPHTKLKRCPGCWRMFRPLGSKSVYCTVACNIACNSELRPNGCLEWTGYRNKNGYGHIRVRGQINSTRVHRFVYETYHGPIPPGLVVRHKCDNPACCNIDHLRIGTRADNVADAVARDRHPRGSKNGHAKITEAEVAAIRLARRHGATYSQLSAQYGLTFASLFGIVKRRTWRHVK